MHDRPRDCRSRRNHVNERCASANGHAQHETRIGSFRGTSDRGSRPTRQPLGIRRPQRTLVLDFVAPDDRHQQIGTTHRLGRGGCCEIQQQLALAATIKLPNDVCVEEKKVAGVLVEMRAQEKAPHFAIAGIGINVNQALEDFSEELRPHAISLAMVLDRHVDREEFAVALLRNLDRTYREIFA